MWLFNEKELQKTNQTQFRVEKVTRKNPGNYVSSRKAVTISLTYKLIKNVSLYKMSWYYPKPRKRFFYKSWIRSIKLCKKADFKKARSVNTSNLPAKSDLASLKGEVDKIDIDNLKTIHPDLSKLRNVVYNNVVKKNHVWKIYCEG